MLVQCFLTRPVVVVDESLPVDELVASLPAMHASMEHQDWFVCIDPCSHHIAGQGVY